MYVAITKICLGFLKVSLTTAVNRLLCYCIFQIGVNRIKIGRGYYRQGLVWMHFNIAFLMVFTENGSVKDEHGMLNTGMMNERKDKHRLYKQVSQLS